MSTRSGKRIHGSFDENTNKVENESIKNGRKTRSKRQKENVDENLTTTAKKRNYVTYPKNEDINENVIYDKTSTAVSPKGTLKEQNLNVSINTEGRKQDVTSGKVTRQTRRNKRSTGDSEDFPSAELTNEVPKNKKKSKKGKKKKSKTESEVSENVIVPVAGSKKSKKKKGKAVESFTLNKSDGSVDSFHSAAGSPVQPHQEPSQNNESPVVSSSDTTGSRRSSKRKPDKMDCDDDAEERSAKKTRKVKSVQADTEPNDLPDIKQSADIVDDQDTTVDKFNEVVEEKLSATFEKETKNKRKSSLKNNTFDKLDVEEKLNATFEKETKNKRKSSLKNNTFDKSDVSPLKLNSTYEKSETIEKNNLTFEKDKPKKRSLRSSTYAVEEQVPETTLNNTFDKSKLSGQPSLNSTYDKETKVTDNKEKVDHDSKKSSLISTDSSTNLTYDKSDCSRISITSDDSNVENIINTTPVLIESSMDDSQRVDMSPKANTDKSKLSLTPEGPKTPAKSAATPLKREGTFTKDGPDVIIMSPKPKLSSERTPVKRMSLPSPGCTPFHVSKSSQKSVLNVTRSIEKGRRSSLIDPAPRTTKVMFCSPVNNPAVVSQQKRKVIKSNLKGSNKSFVFDESVSEPRAAPAPRKRSYTHNDAEEARAKRTRLTAGAAPRPQPPRARTASAGAAQVRASEPSTPSKKPAVKPLTPKGKADAKPTRTKLPNFAALHRKEFARMESLDECQERKAKRAKQLLTPTGAITVLERSSPRDREPSPTEPTKTVKDPAKKNDTPKKAPRISTKPATQTKTVPSTQTKPVPSTQTKPVPPTQPKQSTVTKLPTLESLRPGFTRFGFKMNTDFNPFSIPPKTETKPKEVKINGLKRQLTQPSLNGATSRKEVAKQIMMREKSFTSLSDRRDVKRKETRTTIRGVRTNRRFELQMQMRNMNA